MKFSITKKLKVAHRHYGAPAMQTAVLTVDESFKCSRFKRQEATEVEYQGLSQMPRTVHSIPTKQFLLQGTMVS